MAQDKFYDRPKWLRIRSSVLRRDKYLDAYLARYGKIAPAEVVHHIFPKDEFPQYAYCVWNLISVSRKTHQSFHDRESDRLTKTGLELLLRTARKYGIEVPSEYMSYKKGAYKKRDKYFT